MLFFCGDNDSYIHVGLYILVELSLLGTFVGGSESSKERKSQGAKVPHLELSLPGANGLGSEKSIIDGNPILNHNPIPNPNYVALHYVNNK